MLAVPAASPIAITGGITRTAPAAAESAERQRPATRRFSTLSGTRTRIFVPPSRSSTLKSAASFVAEPESAAVFFGSAAKRSDHSSPAASRFVATED